MQAKTDCLIFFFSFSSQRRPVRDTLGDMWSLETQSCNQTQEPWRPDSATITTTTGSCSDSGVSKKHVAVTNSNDLLVNEPQIFILPAGTLIFTISKLQHHKKSMFSSMLSLTLDLVWMVSSWPMATCVYFGASVPTGNPRETDGINQIHWSNQHVNYCQLCWKVADRFLLRWWWSVISLILNNQEGSRLSVWVCQCVQPFPKPQSFYCPRAAIFKPRICTIESLMPKEIETPFTSMNWIHFWTIKMARRRKSTSEL